MFPPGQTYARFGKKYDNRHCTFSPSQHPWPFFQAYPLKKGPRMLAWRKCTMSVIVFLPEACICLTRRKHLYTHTMLLEVEELSGESFLDFVESNWRGTKTCFLAEYRMQW